MTRCPGMDSQPDPFDGADRFPHHGWLPQLLDKRFFEWVSPSRLQLPPERQRYRRMGAWKETSALLATPWASPIPLDSRIGHVPARPNCPCNCPFPGAETCQGLRRTDKPQPSPSRAILKVFKGTLLHTWH